MPPNWDDADYLNQNPDVARAVALNLFPSGWGHYCIFGKDEGRSPGQTRGFSNLNGSITTRDCLDPWCYLEITPNSGVKPCCNIWPIAVWDPNGIPLEDLRNSEPFKLLRHQLLTGSLSNICRICHIRPMVPVEDFRQSLQRQIGVSSNQDGILAQPLRQLRIEVTKKCNLRCVYCAVSQPGYSATEMAASSFDELVRLISQQPREMEIFVNGHGETTYHPDWLSLCNTIVKQGFRPSIITNLAKSLNRDEAACLAKFRMIQISIDTVDALQLAKIRRRVKLSNIVKNIHMIRNEATTNNQVPAFSISCGIYDANYASLVELPGFCASLGISSVTFWQLIKYDDLPGAPNVYPIMSLDCSIISEVIRILEHTIELLKLHGIRVEVAGEFIESWKARVKSS